jgi:hypothetical protein
VRAFCLKSSPSKILSSKIGGFLLCINAL